MAKSIRPFQTDTQSPNNSTVMAVADERFDYIIVGAGSAGCVLASRLGEDRSARILVLEAGGSDCSPVIKISLTWGLILRN